MTKKKATENVTGATKGTNSKQIEQDAKSKKDASVPKVKKDTRKQDFPVGHFVTYTGKKTGFTGPAEILSYLNAPSTGIVCKLKNGSKKAVSKLSLKLSKKKPVVQKEKK